MKYGDYLNLFLMEDDLNFFLMEDDLRKFQEEDYLNLCCKWKRTYIFLWIEDNLNFFQIEDNLNILVNGRQAQKHYIKKCNLKQLNLQQWLWHCSG